MVNSGKHQRAASIYLLKHITIYKLILKAVNFMNIKKVPRYHRQIWNINNIYHINCNSNIS